LLGIYSDSLANHLGELRNHVCFQECRVAVQIFLPARCVRQATKLEKKPFIPRRFRLLWFQLRPFFLSCLTNRRKRSPIK